MDETANKVEAEMKTLILADAVLIWAKGAKDTGKELNQCNLIFLKSKAIPVRGVEA
jgi:hypothetical protein